MARRNRYRERGTGSIYKKGNHFYLKIRIDDKAKTYILRDQNDRPVTTRLEAEKAAALLRPVLRAKQKEEIALHIAEARKIRKKALLDLDQIWDTFLSESKNSEAAPKTLSGYQSALQLFLDWLSFNYPEIQKPEQITNEIGNQYFHDLWMKHKISAKTYNIYRQALRLIFKTIAEAAGLVCNPFDEIAHKTGIMESRNEFTSDQVQAIFDGFQKGFYYTSEQEGLGPGRKRVRKLVTQEYHPLHKEEMSVLLNLCCWTGCRGQDGCLMKWENVDMEHHQITYVPQKTARKTAWRSVTLPIHPNLLDALRKAQAWRSGNLPGEDYIIPNVAHRYLRNPSGIQKDVMKMIRCATGLETTGKKRSEHRVRNPNLYSLHSFRHTFVSFCANAGVPLDVVASIVGHGSTAMTRHYAHISDEAKNKAIGALPLLKAEEEKGSDPVRETLLHKLSGLPTKELEKLTQHLEVLST